jgi:hypothetical protein
VCLELNDAIFEYIKDADEKRLEKRIRRHAQVLIDLAKNDELFRREFSISLLLKPWHGFHMQKILTFF